MRFDGLRVRGLGPFRDEISIDLHALRGPLVAVTGDNGAGKSTLLELLAGACYRKCPTRGSLGSLATTRDAFVEARVVNGAAWTIRQNVDAISGGGESLVTGEDGAPIISSAKRREFDTWAAKHMPSEEVFFASLFSSQKSGGFLGMKAGPRKAVLLRALGIERLEDLAERARKHANVGKGRVEIARARLADELARGGDVAALEAELATHRTALVDAEDSLAAARAALAEAMRMADAARVAQRAAVAATEARDAITSRIDAARRAIADLEPRIENNRRVLAEATAIRAAVAEGETLDARVGDARALCEEARRRLATADHEAQLAEAAADHARRGRDTVQAQIDALTRRLAGRGVVDAAVNEEAALTAKLAELETRHAALDAERESARTAAADVSGTRITGLRTALKTVAFDECDETQVAAAALRSDDGLVAGVRSAADTVARLRLEIDAIIAAEAEARAALAAARVTAAKIHAVRSDETALAKAKAALAEAEREVGVTAARRSELSRARAVFLPSVATAEHQVAELESARAALQPLRVKAGPLASAEARLAEIEPQRVALVASLSALEAELASVPVPTPAPDVPSTSAAQAVVDGAEQTVRDATTALALVGSRVDGARSAAVRVAALRAEQDQLDDEISNWTRLADDLGRDGLQALEIDAAGPELSLLVNDLLHTCVGPRWTVTIEATRLDANGKKELEGCEVRVLDAQEGRDAAGETLSGGEAVIVNEAISLALTMIGCRRSGVSEPTLIRDESGAALDPVNARSYVQMLRRAAKIVGARHVLFVSHSVEVQDLADSRIEISDRKVRIA